MSTDWTIRKAALDIPCAYCGAPCGTPCRTISDRRATYTHVARNWPLINAFGNGYEEGRRDAEFFARARQQKAVKP